DHISYGIASGYREATPAQLKSKLLDYISTQDAELAHQLKSANGSSSHSTEARASFYAAMIPALDVSTWDQLKASDVAHASALVGDAAGFVDPLTGEGIYYAIKSADLLAEAMTTRVADYEPLWRAEFGAEMRRAAELSERFYRGNFAGAPLT